MKILAVGSGADHMGLLTLVPYIVLDHGSRFWVE